MFGLALASSGMLAASPPFSRAGKPPKFVIVGQYFVLMLAIVLTATLGPAVCFAAIFAAQITNFQSMLCWPPAEWLASGRHSRSFAALPAGSFVSSFAVVLAFVAVALAIAEAIDQRALVFALSAIVAFGAWSMFRRIAFAYAGARNDS